MQPLSLKYGTAALPHSAKMQFSFNKNQRSMQKLAGDRIEFFQVVDIVSVARYR